jgi:hypothetical protein
MINAIRFYKRQERKKGVLTIGSRQQATLLGKKLKRLVNKKSRPNNGFQESQNAHPKTGGNRYEIDGCSDETQSIHSSSG